MAKMKGPRIITANRLTDGRVVWRQADGLWAEEVAKAQILADAEAAAALEKALADAVAAIVVEPYEVEVAPGSQTPVPVTLREKIRASGPTIDLPAA